MRIYNTGWSHTRMDIFTVLPMLALVFALSFDRGMIAGLLQTRLPQALGELVLCHLYRPDVWLLPDPHLRTAALSAAR